MACGKGQVPGETWLNDVALTQWLCLKFREIPLEFCWRNSAFACEARAVVCSAWQGLLLPETCLQPHKNNQMLGRRSLSTLSWKEQMGNYFGLSKEKQALESHSSIQFQKSLIFMYSKFQQELLWTFIINGDTNVSPQFPPLQEASFKSKSSPAVLRINDLSNSLPSIIDKILNT